MDRQAMKDWINFSTEDLTQQFIFASLMLIVLLVSGQIDLASFTQLMSVNLGGFYCKEITNFRGLN